VIPLHHEVCLRAYPAHARTRVGSISDDVAETDNGIVGLACDRLEGGEISVDVRDDQGSHVRFTSFRREVCAVHVINRTPQRWFGANSIAAVLHLLPCGRRVNGFVGYLPEPFLVQDAGKGSYLVSSNPRFFQSLRGPFDRVGSSMELDPSLFDQRVGGRAVAELLA
jgi:hypothetical protein